MEWKEELQNNDFFFNVIKHGKKVIGAAFLIKYEQDFKFVFIENNNGFVKEIRDVFSGNNKKICFDIRSLLLLQVPYNPSIIDLSLFYGKDYDSSQNFFSSVINKHLKEDDVVKYIESVNTIKSHIKACSTSKIKIYKHHVFDVFPKELLLKFYNKKLQALCILYDKSKFDFDKEYSIRTHRFAYNLYELEQNGVRVDLENLEKDISVADKNWLGHVKRIKKDDFVYCKFIPNKSKTGRTQIMAGSFRCLNIPKTKIRKIIKSRFDNGKILVLDFNAIDYRVMINSVNDDELNHLYENCDDFHKRTVDLIFKKNKFLNIKRKIIKNLTYVLIYGGHFNYKQHGITKKSYEKLVENINLIFKPIESFKEVLYKNNIDNGYIEVLGGRKVMAEEDDHPGKVLAKFAQSGTNEVFIQSFNDVHQFIRGLKSKDLFIVHDELVVDLHPDDVCRVRKMVDIMEHSSKKLCGNKFKVNFKLKDNYWE